MTIHELLTRFSKSRRVADGFMVTCPVHPDKNPSLHISGRDDKILLHCHAGCTTESIANALGIKMADLFTGAPMNSPERRIVAIYPYMDEGGRTLFEVVRFEPKDFRQRRPDGNGGWIWALNGTRRVLYRLPEVIKAKSVIVAEGEKDVETARKLGLAATCNPHGAGKWRPEYAEFFRGKRVAIISDADAPGRAHGHEIARSLVGVAEAVRFIEALPEAKDLSEWIERGGTRQRLVALIKETPELTPADFEKRTKPSIAVPGALASEIKPQRVRWLWQNHIPLGKVTVFDGDPGLAKSTASLDLAARITQGLTMPDGTECGDGPAGAVVVSLEDGQGDTIRPRLEAAGADLSKVRIVATVPGSDGIERTPALPVDLPKIEAAIQNVNAKLVIFDPLMAVLGDGTNSNRDHHIRRALAPVAELAERTGAAVIFIRHLNKSGGQNAKYRGGGSIGIIGASRASFLFGEKPGEEGRFVFAPVKGNLWRGKPPALEYNVKEVKIKIEGEMEAQPVIEWGGPSVHTATSLLAQPEGAEESNACAEAKEFLSETLADSSKPVNEIKADARRAGISDRTLVRARYQLGVRAEKVGFGSGQHWEWNLPKNANQAVKNANYQNLASFEQDIETKPFNSNTSSKDAKVGNMASFEGEDGVIRSNDDSSNPKSWTNHAPDEPVENRSLEGEL